MAKDIILTPANCPFQINVGVSSIPKSWCWYNTDRHGNHLFKLLGLMASRKPGSDITLIELFFFPVYCIIGVRWFGIYNPPSAPTHKPVFPKRREDLMGDRI